MQARWHKVLPREAKKKRDSVRWKPEKQGKISGSYLNDFLVKMILQFSTGSRIFTWSIIYFVSLTILIWGNSGTNILNINRQQYFISQPLNKITMYSKKSVTNKIKKQGNNPCPLLYIRTISFFQPFFRRRGRERQFTS